jgi:uncharacterized membrane protein
VIATETLVPCPFLYIPQLSSLLLTTLIFYGHFLINSSDIKHTMMELHTFLLANAELNTIRQQI